MQTAGVGLTDVGMQRDHNEDAFLVDLELGLYVVCDGMGGEAAGEVASAHCIRSLQRRLGKKLELFTEYEANPSVETRDQVVQAITEAVVRASAEIFAVSQADSRKKGMGTTMVMMLVMGRHAVLGCVGDSRIYQVRDGQIHQLTEDQTQAMELVKQGIMSVEEAERSPLANVITQAVGRETTVHVETLHLELMPGDIHLLCSDGLSNYVPIEDMVRVLSSQPPDDAARGLIEIANTNGGKDNITAVILHTMQSAPAAPPPAEAPEAEHAPPEAEPEVEHGVDVQAKLDALKQIPLFQHMTYPELLHVLNTARVTEFGGGSIIIREGTRDFVFYVILQGKVDVFKGTEQVARLGEGVHFGEMCLVDDAPRSATIVAVENVLTLALSRDDVFALIRRHQGLAVKLLWSMCSELSRRLRAANERLSEVTQVHTQRLDPSDTAPFARGEVPAS